VGYDELFWLLSTNGNVLAITNNKTTTRSQTFTYTTDGLNRLAKAVSGTTWGANFSYDAWGNLYSSTGVTGTTYVAMTVNQTGINNKNQFTQGGYGYDVAGNVLNDGLASGCGTSGYQWNAEGQMSCANGTTYAYDGDGLRVKKSSGTLYWSGGVAESDASGNLTSEYVFFGGKRVARRDVSTGTVYYYLSDHLGSSNVVASATGAIVNESDFYPFGGERQITNTLANQHFKFTGKERDSETGLDDFGARFYNSGMGRFMSPDWSAKAEPVPYAKMDNPQSLNLYAYVQNNAITLKDPDGHDLEAPAADETNSAANNDHSYNKSTSSVDMHLDSNGNGTMTVTTVNKQTDITVNHDSSGNVASYTTNVTETTTVSRFTVNNYAASPLDATQSSEARTVTTAAPTPGSSIIPREPTILSDSGWSQPTKTHLDAWGVASTDHAGMAAANQAAESSKPMSFEKLHDAYGIGKDAYDLGRAILRGFF
jgi:RHS repeat-associated protein